MLVEFSILCNIALVIYVWWKDCCTNFLKRQPRQVWLKLWCQINFEYDFVYLEITVRIDILNLSQFQQNNWRNVDNLDCFSTGLKFEPDEQNQSIVFLESTWCHHVILFCFVSLFVCLFVEGILESILCFLDVFNIHF